MKLDNTIIMNSNNVHQEVYAQSLDLDGTNIDKLDLNIYENFTFQDGGGDLHMIQLTASQALDLGLRVAHSESGGLMTIPVSILNEDSSNLNRYQPMLSEEPNELIASDLNTAEENVLNTQLSNESISMPYDSSLFQNVIELSPEQVQKFRNTSIESLSIESFNELINNDSVLCHPLPKCKTSTKPVLKHHMRLTRGKVTKSKLQCTPTLVKSNLINIGSGFTKLQTARLNSNYLHSQDEVMNSVILSNEQQALPATVGCEQTLTNTYDIVPDENRSLLYEIKIPEMPMSLDECSDSFVENNSLGISAIPITKSKFQLSKATHSLYRITEKGMEALPIIDVPCNDIQNSAVCFVGATLTNEVNDCKHIDSHDQSAEAVNGCSTNGIINPDDHLLHNADALEPNPEPVENENGVVLKDDNVNNKVQGLRLNNNNVSSNGVEANNVSSNGVEANLPKSLSEVSVQSAINKISFNPSMPLGSTQNPIRLVQRGQNFHSTQTLSATQLEQIAGALRHRPSPELPNGKRQPHRVVLYDPTTSSRIVYRVMYPEELALTKSGVASNNGNIEDSKARVRGRPKGKTRIDQSLPGQVKQVFRPTARTRSGRLTRPPLHIVQDYKRPRSTDDSDKDDDGAYCSSSQNVLPDSNIVDVDVDKNRQGKDINPDVNEFMDGIQKRNVKRNIKPQYICPSCKKAYLGYFKMAKHLELHPDHGEIKDLGLEPPNPTAKIKKKKDGRSRYPTGQNNFRNKSCGSNDALQNANEHNDSGLDILSSLNLTHVKNNKEIDCDNIRLSSEKLNSDHTDSTDHDRRSIYDILMSRISSIEDSQKVDRFCTEITDFVQKVQKLTVRLVLPDDDVRPGASSCDIQEPVSRVLGINPGQYNIDKTVFNKTNETDMIQTVTSSTVNTDSCSTPYSMSQINSDNHTEENMDIDITCTAMSQMTSMQKQIQMLINHDEDMTESSIEPVHDDNEPDNMKYEINMNSSINDINISNNLTLTDNNATGDSINIIPSDISMNSGEDVFQNVDELVSERLQNLTADELAVMPHLAVSDDASSRQQAPLSLPELSLDLFQFPVPSFIMR